MSTEETEKEIPIFTLHRFNPRRHQRGVEAAEVKVKWPDGNTEYLWMSKMDIEANAVEYGWQDGLRQALQAYQNPQSRAS